MVSGVLPGLEPSAGVVPAGRAGRGGRSVRGELRLLDGGGQVAGGPGLPERAGARPVEIDTDDDPGDVALANTVGFELAAGRHPDEGRAPALRQRTSRFITTGKQQLFRTGWVGLWPSAGAYLSPLFRSTSLDNSTAFNSADGGRAAAAAAGHGQRIAAPVRSYENLQRTIMADYAVLPLASYSQVLALSKRVHDYAPRLDGTFDVNRVEVKAGGHHGTTGK